MAVALDPGFMQSIPIKDRLAYEFYYAQAENETLPVTPEYTWNQFAQLGYAAFQETTGYTLETLDETASKLIPNYAEESGEFPAMLDAFKGKAGDSIYKHTEAGKAAIVNCSHPSLATPIIVARSLIEAYGPDIRRRLYVVYGLLPTVFKYEFDNSELSPVSVARSLGNVMLTAAKTPSNDSKDEEVTGWQQSQRTTFKKVFEEVTLPKAEGEQGAIVVVCVTGQRKKFGPVLRPDGSLNYLHHRSMWSVGVEDSLLGRSHVWMKVAEKPIHVSRDMDVHESNRQTCALASHGNTIFGYEGRLEQTRRQLAQGIIPKAPFRARSLRLG